MLQLRDLPVLRATPGAGFAQAELADFDDQAPAAAPVIVIDPHVEPEQHAELFALEPALASCGKVIGFPALSLVSGMIVPCGLRYVPQGRALGQAAEITVPLPIGHLAGNDTPENAFVGAHHLWFKRSLPRSDAARHRLALGLSLGADQDHGEWWIAGGLAGVLGLDCAAEFAALMRDPASLLPARQSLARRVRVDLGLPVEVFDRTQSATLRSLMSGLCPADLWQDFGEACEQIGSLDLAARYNRAAERIWAGQDMRMAVGAST